MKVLLIPNFPGWAFDNIAQGIKKYGTFDYDIIYERDYRKYRGGPIPKEVLDWDKYDLIVMFAPWMAWKMPLEKTICLYHEKFECDGYNNLPFKKAFVSNDILKNYLIEKQHGKNVVKVQTGLNFDIFRPMEKTQGTKLRVGWVGAKSGHVEKKGYDEYYLPIGNDPDIELVPHLKEEHFVNSREDFVKYYSTIDVLVCTSSFEGYPLPILEASACGVPVVSTAVGIAPELLPEDQIVERDPKAFIERLKKPLVVADVSEWDWNIRIVEWERQFKQNV